MHKADKHQLDKSDVFQTCTVHWREDSAAGSALLTCLDNPRWQNLSLSSSVFRAEVLDSAFSPSHVIHCCLFSHLPAYYKPNFWNSWDAAWDINDTEWDHLLTSTSWTLLIFVNICLFQIWCQQNVLKRERQGATTDRGSCGMKQTIKPTCLDFPGKQVHW